MSWLLLTYRVPSEPSRARVAVWREVRRSGALQLQQSVVAMPDTPAFLSVLQRIRATVADVGGETLALRGDPLTANEAEALTRRWNEARNAEYEELTRECRKYLAEIDKEIENQKFTLAELEEEEAELDKLRAWHDRIAARDVHAAAGANEAREAVGRTAAAFDRFSEAVYERTQA
jgi:hypothetical protein